MQKRNLAGWLIVSGIVAGALSLFFQKVESINVFMAVAFPLFVVLGLIFGFHLNSKDPPHYGIYPRQRYLSVKDSCKKILILENQNCKIHINILGSGELWMGELVPPPSPSARADGRKVKEISLSVNTFFVSRQRNGFRVSWSKGENWKLVD